MSVGEWYKDGWTCPHRRSKSYGPCPQCLPGSGICEDCGKPIDDHNGWGTVDFRCPQKADAK